MLEKSSKRRVKKEKNTGTALKSFSVDLFDHRFYAKKNKRTEKEIKTKPTLKKYLHIMHWYTKNPYKIQYVWDIGLSQWLS